MEKSITSPPTLENLCIAHLLFNIGNAIALLTSNFYWVCTSGDYWHCKNYNFKYKIETLFYGCIEGPSLLCSTNF